MLIFPENVMVSSSLIVIGAGTVTSGGSFGI